MLEQGMWRCTVILLETKSWSKNMDEQVGDLSTKGLNTNEYKSFRC